MKVSLTFRAKALRWEVTKLPDEGPLLETSKILSYFSGRSIPNLLRRYLRSLYLHWQLLFININYICYAFLLRKMEILYIHFPFFFPDENFLFAVAIAARVINLPNGMFHCCHFMQKIRPAQFHLECTSMTPQGKTDLRYILCWKDHVRKCIFVCQ